jgi:hypothetical protein
MYHYNILQTDKNKTIRKIYEKQKEQTTKGDWFEHLQNDFKFIQEEMDEEKIKQMDKETYKKYIKEKVTKAAFQYFLNEKSKRSKLNEIEYKEFGIQNYLINSQFNNKEQNLLYTLRSRCYDSKNNFKKMNKHNIKCIFGCNSLEDQRHTFIICQKIKSQMTGPDIRYENIFGNISEQKEVVEIFLKIDETRTRMKHNLLPGGE